MALGGFLDDVWDATGGRVVDVATSAADAVPVARELHGALKDFAEGPLRDFANTPVGTAVFRALSSSLTGPLAELVGPQVASIAFAIPGLVRGDDFTDAWLTEFSWRAQTAIDYAGPALGDAVAEQFAEALKKLGGIKAATASLGIDDPFTGKTLRQLADEMGLREDAVAYAMQLLRHTLQPYWPMTFDPISGRQVDVAKTGAAQILSQSKAAIASGPRFRTTTSAGSVTAQSTVARFFGAPAPAPEPMVRAEAPAPSGPSTKAIVIGVAAVAAAIMGVMLLRK